MEFSFGDDCPKWARTIFSELMERLELEFSRENASGDLRKHISFHLDSVSVTVKHIPSGNSESRQNQFLSRRTRRGVWKPQTVRSVYFLVQWAHREHYDYLEAAGDA